MKRLCLLMLLLAIGEARADDWPQWMGPKRDNVWREEGILEKFPKSGAEILWRTPTAGGYAGPAVAGNLVYLTDFDTTEDVKVDNFGRKPNRGKERVRCLDATTGKEIWKYEYPVTYSISYPAGPRCTPTVHEGKVYTLGAEGNLFCFDALKGTVLWSHELKKDYDTKSALWGYAAHPLIDGKKLITLAGGKGSHVIALDKDTGKEIWKARTAQEQGYSPVKLIEAGGKRQLIVSSPNAISSLDPETGSQYWSTPYEASNGCIVMTPVISGDYMFVGGFQNKSLMLKLSKEKPEVAVEWRDQPKQGICPVNVQPMIVDNTLYGVDGDGKLYGVEIPSGKRLWDTSEPVSGERPAMSGTAFIYKNGDRFFLFNEKGELVIGKMSPKGWEEIDRAKVLSPTNTAFGRDVLWCAPAFANKRMYVRNDKEIICVNLAK
jgi:outer membrane protein assembly factor BamB